MDRKQLLKITKYKNHWYFNPDDFYKGRSIYLEKDEQHLEKMKKMYKKFNISKDDLETIIQEINSYEQKNI